MRPITSAKFAVMRPGPTKPALRVGDGGSVHTVRVPFGSPRRCRESSPKRRNPARGGATSLDRRELFSGHELPPGLVVTCKEFHLPVDRCSTTAGNLGRCSRTTTGGWAARSNTCGSCCETPTSSSRSGRLTMMAAATTTASSVGRRSGTADGTNEHDRGYVTVDDRHWICEPCYADFKDRFGLNESAP